MSWTSLFVLAGLSATVLVTTRIDAKRSEQERPLQSLVFTVAVFAILALSGALASYGVAALTTGYNDAQLHRLDLLVGFDWLQLYRFVAQHPALQATEVVAYRCIYLIPALLLGNWAWTRRGEIARRFLLEFWACAVVTLVIFSLMPAAGPLGYLWRGAIAYMPDSELCQPHLIAALRDHALTRIDVWNLCGLVSAPSFHAVAAGMYFRYALSTGPLRWSIIVLTVSMLLATPVEGTHYLVDIVLGLSVAVIVMVVGTIAFGRSARRQQDDRRRSI